MQKLFVNNRKCVFIETPVGPFYILCVMIFVWCRGHMSDGTGTDVRKPNITEPFPFTSDQDTMEDLGLIWSKV